MRNLDKWFFALCGLCVVLAIFAVLLPLGHVIQVCRLAVALEPPRAKHYHSCAEFWLYRYQTLLAAAATLGGGALAYFAVQRQTAVGRASEYRNTLAELRELAIDVSALRGALFRVSNVRAMGMPISTAATNADIQKVTDGYRADWQDGRAQMSTILRRFYRLVVTTGMAKAVADLSRTTAEIDNFGFKLMQRLAQSAVYAVFAQQQAYVQSVLNHRAQEGDDIGTSFFRACDVMSAALRREAKAVEDELIRIAPPPGE